MATKRASSTPRNGTTPKNKAAPRPPPAIMTESPVPGVNIQLASLLVQAIKTRRKFLSKSSSSSALSPNNNNRNNNAATTNEENDSLLRQSASLQNLENASRDATAAFLNEFRRQVELFSPSSSSSSGSNTNFNSGQPQPSSFPPAPPPPPSSRRKNSNNAATHCLQFLLEISSNTTNSFHLRRSSLALTREILERSSHARAYLASDRHILTYIISVVQEVDESGGGDDDANNESIGLFQQELIDLIHHLALRYGPLYSKFIVASRMLGDVSVSLSSVGTANDDYGCRRNSATLTNDNNSNVSGDDDGDGGGRNKPKANVMRLLRKDRDVALEHGNGACDMLQKLIDKGDGLFRLLVPRFGGLVSEFSSSDDVAPSGERFDVANDVGGKHLEDKEKHNDSNKEEIESFNGAPNNLNSSIDSNSNLGDVYNANGIGDEDDDEDESIDWEEGDNELSDDFDENEDNKQIISPQNDTPTNHPTNSDHHAAVERTLAIMEHSGALLEGELDVRVGTSIETNTSTAATTDMAVDATNTPALQSDSKNPQSKERIGLQKLVNTLTTKRRPRLNRWIHALSHADGMVERAVADPAGAPGTLGPVSLVLLPKEKRAMRGPILQRMLKLRGDMEGVLQLAERLGVIPEVAGGNKKRRIDQVGDGDNCRMEQNQLAKRKHIWLPGAFFVGDNTRSKKKKKQQSNSKLQVIYSKKR